MLSFVPLRAAAGSILLSTLLATLPSVAAAPEKAQHPHADLAVGVAAKLACSGVFVSRREIDSVVQSDIVPLLALEYGIAYDLDWSGGTVTARAGQVERTAHFRSGIGCTLLFREASRSANVSPRPSRAMRVASSSQVSTRGKALAAALDAAMADDSPDHSLNPRAIVVMRHGRIIGERYAPGFSARTPLLGWSMSKSITAVIAGMLIADGRLRLDDPVRAPEWAAGDPRLAINVRHLIQMTSGLSFVENYSPGHDSTKMLFAEADMAGYAASKPLIAEPGTRWSYSSGSTNILARLIVATLGGPQQTRAYMRDRLFRPAGMRGVTFEEDAQGTPVGSSYVYAPARAWARFGQLLLNRGRADGRQVLAREWVDFVRTPTQADSSGNYGGGFWLNGRASDGRNRRFPNLPVDAFFARGHNGQVLGIFPSQDVVIVRLAWTTGASKRDIDGIFSPILAAADTMETPGK